MPGDVHAEDCLRRLARRRRVARSADPAGLAPLARRRLGLDHHRPPDRRRVALRLPGAARRQAPRDRDARRFEQRLRRVFFEVHSPLSVKFFRQNDKDFVDRPAFGSGDAGSERPAPVSHGPRRKGREGVRHGIRKKTAGRLPGAAYFPYFSQ